MKTPLTKVTLERLIKELADLKFALDASAIVGITDKSGKITYANDKFCEVSKYSQEELIGQDHRIVNSGYHPKEYIRQMWRTIKAGKVWKGEFRNRKKDGSFYWVNSTIVPFLDENGKPYQYISIRNEITQRKQMEEEVKNLSRKIIQAQEFERDKIAREIHDDLGQSLATLKVLIQSTMNETNLSKKHLRSAYQKIVRSIDQIIDKSRHLAYGLRPATLEILGLSTAIKALIQDFRVKRGLKVQYRGRNLDKLIFQGGVINFYRIIQEALTNVVAHSGATEVDILMKRKNNLLSVVVKDNGIGFNLSKKEDPKDQRHGIGLSTMEERTKLLSGELKIESQNELGTTITLTVPVRLAKLPKKNQRK